MGLVACTVVLACMGEEVLMYGMSPYGGMPPSGPLSGLNQFLFGVQNVVFSLGQAVQVSLSSEESEHEEHWTDGPC
jgi:hypothetical protein